MHEPADGSAPDDESLAKVAREIEARLILVLEQGVGTGFLRGSDEHVELMARNAALGASGSVIAGSTDEMNSMWPALLSLLLLGLNGKELEKPELLNWNIEEHLELLVDAVRPIMSLATDWPYTLNALLKTPTTQSLYAKWPLVQMSKVPTLQEKRDWVCEFMRGNMSCMLESMGRFHLITANHPSRDEINAFFAEKGARLRSRVATYDMSAGVDVKHCFMIFNWMVTGMAGFYGGFLAGSSLWRSRRCQAGLVDSKRVLQSHHARHSEWHFGLSNLRNGVPFAPIGARSGNCNG